MALSRRFLPYVADVFAGIADGTIDPDGELRQRSFELAFDDDLPQRERDSAYLAGLDIGRHDLYAREAIKSDPRTALGMRYSTSSQKA